MEWTSTYPKKAAFYWVISPTGKISIIKRSGKTKSWSFGGDKADPKNIALWGDVVDVAPEGWMKNEPVEEGWYGVEYKDKTKSIVCVAIGSKLHCYDYDVQGEIDMKKTISWNGPLKVPSPPAKK